MKNINLRSMMLFVLMIFVFRFQEGVHGLDNNPAVAAVVVEGGAGDTAQKNEQHKTLDLILSTEKTLEGEVEDMLWCGDNNKIVFVLTSLGGVYRSNDHGKTWSSITSYFQNLVIGTSTTKRSTKIQQLIQHPTMKERILFVGEGTSYGTINCGESFVLAGDGYVFTEVIMHPTEGSLIIASTLSPTCLDETVKGTCFKTVYLTQDFGSSWKKLDSHIIQFGWTHSLPPSHTQGIPQHSILFTQEDSPDHDKSQMFQIWDKHVSLWRSDDFLSTKEMLVKSGNRFLFSSKYLLVAKVRSNDFHVQLMISVDGSRTFTQAGLPFEMAEHAYTVLDTAEDVVFLHVNHWGGNSLLGNIYISNSHGLNYTLSLPHNVRNMNGQCDFERVHGLEGVYIANFIDNVEFDAAYNDRLHNTQDPYAVSHNSALLAGEGGQSKLRSVITFDKGGSWSFIAPPTVDSTGDTIACDTSAGCSLNLYGLSSSHSYFYSNENAIGLVLAVGNVGMYLHKSSPGGTGGGGVNTFMSRDGGWTWVEIAKGSYIFELGDHGGLIVMVRDTEPTNIARYSWDEGMTWTDYKFSETPLLVNNIIIEPNSISQRFMIYGTRNHPQKVTTGGGTSDTTNQGEQQQDGEYYAGVITYLDFTGLHTRSCVDVDTPNTGHSDYETWSPAAYGEKCLMGHQIEYTRRKRDSACYNGDEMDRSHYVTDCECTEMDWECDFSHFRSLKANGESVGSCEKLFDVNHAAFMEQQCSVGDKYYIPNGYRRVAGNTCVGGVDHAPIEYHCTSSYQNYVTSIGHTGFGLVSLSMVVMLIVVGGLLYVSTSRKSSSRGKPASNQSSNQDSRYSLGNQDQVMITLQEMKNTIVELFFMLKEKLSPSPRGYRYHNVEKGFIPHSALDADDDDDITATNTSTTNNNSFSDEHTLRRRNNMNHGIGGYNNHDDDVTKDAEDLISDIESSFYIRTSNK